MEIQRLSLFALVPARIKINHVLNLLATAIHDPIVPVKGGLVAHPRPPPGARGQAGAQATETGEFRAAAGFAAAACFPGFDFVPGALVDGVVDGDNGLHVRGLRVVGFAAHGFEEHLFRRVDPVSGCLVGGGVMLAVCGAGGGGGGQGGESPWDGADFAVGAEAGVGEEGDGCWGGGCGGLVEGG